MGGAAALTGIANRGFRIADWRRSLPQPVHEFEIRDPKSAIHAPLLPESS
jgi:hypothetical protein